MSLVIGVVVAGLVLAAGDRLPGYHRVDGPLLLEVGPGRGIHLGDLVVLAACLAVGIGAVARARSDSRPR